MNLYIILLITYITILILLNLIEYKRFLINKKCFIKLTNMVFIKNHKTILGYNKGSEYTYIFADFTGDSQIDYRFEYKKYVGVYFKKYDFLVFPYNFYYYLKIKRLLIVELNSTINNLFLQKEREEKISKLLNT